MIDAIPDFSSPRCPRRNPHGVRPRRTWLLRTVAGLASVSASTSANLGPPPSPGQPSPASAPTPVPAPALASFSPRPSSSLSPQLQPQPPASAPSPSPDQPSPASTPAPAPSPGQPIPSGKKLRNFFPYLTVIGKTSAFRSANAVFYPHFCCKYNKNGHCYVNLSFTMR